MTTNPRIEIVEDEMLIARELEARLLDLGYDVPLIVSSADEAVRAVGEIRPDLVMMDIVIKGERDGIDAAAEIIKQYGIPVVYLTAYADPQTLERAKVTGPFGYIVKPFSVSELRATVEMALYKSRMEARLRSAERRLAATVRSVGEALIATDDQHHIVHMNPAAETLTGWAQADALGSPVAPVVALRDAADKPLIDRLIEHASQSSIGVQLADNASLVSRAGQVVPVAGSASPILNDDGRWIGVVLVLRDISERLREEGRRRLLAGASEVLASSLDLSSTLASVARLSIPMLGACCAVHLVSEDGILRRAAYAEVADTPGGAMSDTLTAGAEALAEGQPGERVVRADALPQTMTTLVEAEMHDAPFAQMSATRANIPALVVALPSRGGVLGTLTFIAAQASHGYTVDDRSLAGELARRVALAVENAGLYHAAQRLNDELEQRVIDRTAALTAANEELGAFSSSVSHDLRTPLRHVAGFIELVRDEANSQLGDAQRGYLQRAFNATQRMNQMIDDLLAFSRLGRTEIHKTRFAMGSLVREVIADFEHDARKRQIEWSLLPLPDVDADRAMLRLVWQNLISNALKYTGKRAEAHIEIGCVAHDQEQFFHIRDNGVGFDPEYADKLFGVFQRLHSQSEFEGTGIGLANVRRIIQRHGGTAWAVSAVNAGATFYFSLPIVR